MTPPVIAGPPSAAAIGRVLDGLPLSRFHIAALAFQRATQLKNGARPRVDAAGHRPTRLALLEVMADTISWTIV